MAPKRLDPIEAIEYLKERFPQYDFNKAVYTKTCEKITVICPEHGEFQVTYNNMKSKGKGCAKCNGGVKYTQEDALNKLIKIFPNYTFEKFVYQGPSKPATITCKIHGDVTKVYYYLSKGAGCTKCGDLKTIPHRKTKVKPLSEAIQELKEKYPDISFDKFDVKDKKARGVLECSKHGIFTSTVENMFIANYPCQYCTGMRNQDPVQELKDLGTKFDFSKFEYITSKKRSIVICPEHGEFEDSYFNIMIANQGAIICPVCNPIGSHSKKEYDIFESLVIKYPYLNIEQANRRIVYNDYTKRFLELDIYLKDINLAIEFNGTYWHSDEVIKYRASRFNSAEEYHNYKFEKCKEKDIYLHFITEEEYDKDRTKVLEDIYRLIESRLNNELSAVKIKSSELLERP